MVNAYVISTPVILVLTLSEILYCYKRQNNYYDFKDTLTNFSTAILNQCMNIIVFIAAAFLYSSINANSPFVLIQYSIVSLIVCILCADFLFYWFHRLGHTYNILWASHMPHHSTKEMNYSVAIRSSITQRMMSLAFYWPMALFFPKDTILLAVSTNLVLQFWQHTRVIKKLPSWFEFIFNSPSHHRVHHGINSKYLNKNYAGIIILWDRAFGTFQKEEEEVEYGVLQPLNSYNPLDVYFQYFTVCFMNVKKMKGLKNKLAYLFGRMENNKNLNLLKWDKNIEGKELSFKEKILLICAMTAALLLMYFSTSYNFNFTNELKALMSFGILIIIVAIGKFLNGEIKYE